jgi:hypothetical protein
MLNSQTKQPETLKVEPKTQPRRPNEQGSFDVQAHVRIFDPQTKQVYVEGRA